MLRKFFILLTLLISATLCNNQLNFLHDNPTKPAENFIKSNYTQKVVYFIDGYLNGTGVYDTITTNKDCLYDLEIIEEEVMEIIQVAKEINYENVFKNLRKIIELAEVVAKNALLAAKSCNEIFEKIVELSKKIKQKLYDPAYIPNFFSHTLLNIGKIKELAELASESFKNKDYQLSGYYIGKLERFAFYWDVTNYALI